MSLDCEVVTTRSGARAMRDRLTGELMHPVVGPLVEAEALYVTPSRLRARLGAGGAEPLVVLDVGLGAGTNAIAAWKVSEAAPPGARPLELVSFDRSFGALDVALQPEHAAQFGFDAPAAAAARALRDTGAHATARTRWRMRHGELLASLDAEPPASADVVFWDPFSPRANPELWTVAAFRALRRVCRAGATVHTYSASTRVRSALLLAGFAVGAGDDIGEYKQTTLAAADLCDLTRPLDRRFLQRLLRSSAPFPTDAPADAHARLAALPQLNA
jgi:queuine tRNA-ribosyltransferase